jgi:Rieske Fe-S protein
LSETQSNFQSHGRSRRAVLAGAGVTCAALLAGCTTYDANNGGIDGQAPAPATPTPAGTTGGSPAGGPQKGGSGSGGTPVANVLAATADVPEGGGKIIPGKAIVLTQPAAGTFKAFSAVCTHQGCAVNAIANGTIDCPCHGSKFSIKDGSVVNGPATSPLPPVAIKVDGTSIVPG